MRDDIKPRPPIGQEPAEPAFWEICLGLAAGALFYLLAATYVLLVAAGLAGFL